MSNYSAVGLYDHNITSYEKARDAFKTQDIVSIIQATGTGKTYNALQLAYDNKDMKIIYFVPQNSITEHIIETINNNPNLDLKKDFPKVEFRTYQSLINLSEEELASLYVDMIILDEFHHLGAPVWGSRINEIIKTHEGIKVFGMTAYTVRDRGTAFERDMVNDNGRELFSGSVVSNYDLCDAIIDGVLPKPIYKSGYVELLNLVENIEKDQNLLDDDSKTLLADIKRRLHEGDNIKDIFKANIKRDGKYIYFCPPISLEDRNDIKTIKKQVESWILEMGLTRDDYELYITTSMSGSLGSRNRKAFYNDEDLRGNSVKNKLRIMFAINQYNEGVHAPGLDGVIMGRSTGSDIVYFEQLGRALSVCRNDEEDRLSNLSIEELISLCRSRSINLSGEETKDELIELLNSPVVIDLANNLGFINTLEDNIRDRVREAKEYNETHRKRIIKLKETKFNISMLHEDLYTVLKNMYERVSKQKQEKEDITPEKMIENIIYFCEKVGIFPHDVVLAKDNPELQKMGRDASKWLYKYGFKKSDLDNNINTFVYANEVYKDGRTYVEILNSLYSKLKKQTRTPEDYIDEIIKFCLETKKFPTVKENIKVGNLTSSQLSSWLRSSGFKMSNLSDNKYSFKFSNKKYKDGRTYIEILDELCSLYLDKDMFKQKDSYSLDYYMYALLEFCNRYRKFPNEGSVEEIIINDNQHRKMCFKGDQLYKYFKACGYDYNDPFGNVNTFIYKNSIFSIEGSTYYGKRYLGLIENAIMKYLISYDQRDLEISEYMDDIVDYCNDSVFLSEEEFNSSKNGYSDALHFWFIALNFNLLKPVLSRLNYRGLNVQTTLEDLYYDHCKLVDEIKLVEKYCKMQNKLPNSFVETLSIGGYNFKDLDSNINSMCLSKSKLVDMSRVMKYINDLVSEYTTEETLELIDRLEYIKENADYVSMLRKKMEYTKLEPEEYVDLIIYLCKSTHKFPTETHNPLVLKAVQWLQSSGYRRRNIEDNINTFKYANEIYKDGRTYVDIINELYLKYGNPKPDKQLYIDEIIKYCNETQKFPGISDTVVGKLTSSQMHSWLITNGFRKNSLETNEFTFRFASEIYKDGRRYVDILNELCSLYVDQRISERAPQVSFDFYVLSLLHYCKVYKTFPYEGDTNMITISDINARRWEFTGDLLYRWLESSGYNFDDFAENYKTFKYASEIYNRDGLRQYNNSECNGRTYIDLIREARLLCDVSEEKINRRK